MEKIIFDNGSIFESLKNNKNTRGNRGRYFECVCYNIKKDRWEIGCPIGNDNLVPEWQIAELLSK